MLREGKILRVVLFVATRLLCEAMLDTYAFCTGRTLVLPFTPHEFW